MAQNTAIEWSDHTWNPWRGCLKVSPGCKDCYMYADQKRYGLQPDAITRVKDSTFYSPLGWAKKPEHNGQFVFTCSWSDWFIAEADRWRDAAWDVIKRTPELCYLILTKRPENIADRLPADWGNGYPNVWLGVSAENQMYADKRLPVLVDIPAARHFVSYEPALGAVDFSRWGHELDWIICGGESSWKFRPMETEWARGVRDTCQAFGISFFLKQLGGTPNRKRGGLEAVLDGRHWTERPAFTPTPAQLDLFGELAS